MSPAVAEVLGEASGATVSAVFAVFEPNGLAAMWDEGVAVRGAAGAAQQYWEQAAEFGHKYLSDAQGLDRIAALGGRSSPRRRSRACRCSPAGVRCRWPTMRPRARCR